MWEHYLEHHGCSGMVPMLPKVLGLELRLGLGLGLVLELGLGFGLGLGPIN